MQFTEKLTFAVSDHLSGQRSPDPAPRGLLVGTMPVATFDDRHGAAGHRSNQLFPAWCGGERMWLRRAVWQAARGYSATGVDETLHPFAWGVERLIEAGVYAFPEPKETAP